MAISGSQDVESLEWASFSEKEKSFGDEVVSATVPDKTEDEPLALT